MSSDCRLHVAVTPFSKSTIPDGVKALNVEDFNPAQLERRQWPRIGHQRTPEGGSGGDIVPETILIQWVGGKLIYPHSENAQPLAEKRRPNEIVYLASYVAQLDGQVAYLPDTGSNTSYVILFEDRVAQTHAIRFSPGQTAIIDPFIKHSLPIPMFGGAFEFIAWHRATNASIRLDPDPAGLATIVVNLNKVNRVHGVGVRHVEYAKESTKKSPHLSSGFAKEMKPINDASHEAIEPYGKLIHDFSLHDEKVIEVIWPHSEDSCSLAGVLRQEFVMSWRPVTEAGDLLELEFEGLSGTLAGEKGRPGVEYNSELGIYKTDLIMARPDGSFYVQPLLHSEAFIMALALPDEETGEPIESSLKAFFFRNGNAVKLSPRMWHSVPIPVAGTGPIVFTELIAATNAHIVANVKAETGHPIQLVQAV